ncbi:Ubiquitin carboxyl-terminal hydrolase 17-like protein A [Holothuria leucospilota]|uniref:Ubiquitin carboxyl-terminal hydrolase 17-like protein A n=1 Tax=Holothuria leucospilota TaxID=206669 RepID=A0A9Q0YL30_HOLLE|nr:Ubiquitin carboxyl-terminal hydrolase 17-like protein A [Holothuria leucospilota]
MARNENKKKMFKIQTDKSTLLKLANSWQKKHNKGKPGDATEKMENDCITTVPVMLNQSTWPNKERTGSRPEHQEFQYNNSSSSSFSSRQKTKPKKERNSSRIKHQEHQYENSHKSSSSGQRVFCSNMMSEDNDIPTSSPVLQNTLSSNENSGNRGEHQEIRHHNPTHSSSSFSPVNTYSTRPKKERKSSRYQEPQYENSHKSSSSSQQNMMSEDNDIPTSSPVLQNTLSSNENSGNRGEHQEIIDHNPTHSSSSFSPVNTYSTRPKKERKSSRYQEPQYENSHKSSSSSQQNMMCEDNDIPTSSPVLQNTLSSNENSGNRGEHQEIIDHNPAHSSSSFSPVNTYSTRPKKERKSSRYQKLQYENSHKSSSSSQQNVTSEDNDIPTSSPVQQNTLSSNENSGNRREHQEIIDHNPTHSSSFSPGKTPSNIPNNTLSNRETKEDRREIRSSQDHNSVHSSSPLQIVTFKKQTDNLSSNTYQDNTSGSDEKRSKPRPSHINTCYMSAAVHVVCGSGILEEAFVPDSHILRLIKLFSEGHLDWRTFVTLVKNDFPKFDTSEQGDVWDFLQVVYNSSPTEKLQNFFFWTTKTTRFCTDCPFTWSSPNCYPLTTVYPNDKRHICRTSDLFKRSFGPEKISGANCENCKSKSSIYSVETIESMPEVISIQVSRWSTRNSRKSRFPITVDEEMTVGVDNYHLFGLLIHIGSDTFSGHYYCVMKEGNSWFDVDNGKRRIGTRDMAWFKSSASGAFYRKGNI